MHLQGRESHVTLHRKPMQLQNLALFKALTFDHLWICASHFTMFGNLVVFKVSALCC